MNETPSYKIPSTNVNLICQACAIGGDLKKFVNNNEISLGLYKLNKFLRPQYPKIILVPSTGEDSSDEENPTDEKSTGQLSTKGNDDPNKKTQSTDSSDDNGVKSMDRDEEEDKGKEVDDKGKDTKKGEDNDEQSESTITNKNGGKETTMECDDKRDQTSVQMEDNLLYMDLHLNVPATSDKSSPIALIATLSTQLEGWLKGMQEMDETFKLHTVNPNYKSQKVLHHQKDYPTNKLAELKEFFKGA